MSWNKTAGKLRILRFLNCGSWYTYVKRTKKMHTFFHWWFHSN